MAGNISGSVDRRRIPDRNKDKRGRNRDTRNMKSTFARRCNKSLLPAGRMKCCGHRDSNRSRRNSPGNSIPQV